jgi:Concanavalin A-like lectin/glucanases superfamily
LSNQRSASGAPQRRVDQGQSLSRFLVRMYFVGATKDWQEGQVMKITSISIISKAVRFWSLIPLLTCIMVGHSMAQSCTPPPPGMTGWWPGDGNTKDIKGTKNGFLRNGATYATGKVGQAFSLDGVDDFVEIPDDSTLNIGAGDFTVDLWVNLNDKGREQLLVEKYAEDFSGNAPGWGLSLLSNNSIVFVPNGPTTPPLEQVLGTTNITNTWVHVAGRRQGTTATILVNGIPVASGTLGSSASTNTASSLKFGHRGSPSDTPGSSDGRGFFLKGRIDEVELFVGTALLDAQIQAIYNVGSAGKCKLAANNDSYGMNRVMVQ